MVRLWDPDPWWHLASGRWIVEHHAIPRVDPFSFTMAGAPWHVVDWLAELVMYGAWSLGGDTGVGVLTALAAFVMLASVAGTLRALDVGVAATAALVVCVGVLVQGRYSMARPMSLGAALLAAMLFALVRTWQRHDRSALAVVPLVLVWSVIHPAAVIALPLVVLFAASALAARHAATRTLVATALATLATFALVPSMRDIVRLAIAHDRAPLMLALTNEWRLTRLSDRALWLPLVATVVAAAVALRARGRRAWPLVGAALVGAALASRFARNLNEAILLAAPLWGVAVAEAEAALAPRTRAAALYVVLVVALVLPAVQVRLWPATFNPHFGVGPEAGSIPTLTLATARALPPGRIMHDCTAGGWLIWQRVPVYCDGRTVTLYREPDVERLFVPLYADAATVEAQMDRFDMRYALARFDSDFERTLMRSAAFVPLAYDREYSLFVRRRALPEMARPLAELRFVNDAAWLSAWYHAIAADPARAQALADDVRRTLAAAPTSRVLVAAMSHVGHAEPALAETLARAVER